MLTHPDYYLNPVDAVLVQAADEFVELEEANQFKEAEEAQGLEHLQEVRVVGGGEDQVDEHEGDTTRTVKQKPAANVVPVVEEAKARQERKMTQTKAHNEKRTIEGLRLKSRELLQTNAQRPEGRREGRGGEGINNDVLLGDVERVIFDGHM